MVVFREEESIENVLRKPDVDVSIFTKWMECNKQYSDARTLTYAEFSTKWVWHNTDKIWIRRKGKRSVGRIYYCYASSGERYYLRMLLNVIKGPTYFSDLRTINGVTYTTFKEACYALGMLDDDKEWIECIVDASFWASGR